MTQQKLLADSASSGNASVLRRSGITLMYAHWEGFIKDASVYYLTYLSSSAIEIATLRSCFAAIALGGEIKTAGQARKVSIHARLIDRFRSLEIPPPAKKRLPVAGVISTRSNLKSQVLREITTTLGLDYTPFQLKEKSVIDRLVRFRNSIAHGNGLAVQQADYNDLHVETVALLDKYKDLIEDAAINNRHLK